MTKSAGVFDTISQMQKRAVLLLLLLVLGVQSVLSFYEVRTTAQSLYKMLQSQIVSVTSRQLQMGDLLSLQQNLESITAPVTETFPIEIQILRQSDRKLVVSTSSTHFNEESWFLYRFSSVFQAMPFGEMSLIANFDYSNLVGVILLKAFLIFFILTASWFFVRRLILKSTRENLFPLQQFSTWLSSLNPEAVRLGKIELPVEAQRSKFLAGGLERLYSQINNLAIEVAGRESDRKLAEVAVQVSHDIRAPLSALNVVFKTAHNLSDEQKQLIANASDRINGIANDLLEKNKISISSSTELVPLITNIVEEKKVKFSGTKKIVFSVVSLEGQHVSVQVDRVELSRVISNLIDNSIEAIAGAGEVLVQLRSEGSKVSILVQDSGRGIPPDQMSRLGQKGFSFGKSKPDSSSGSGLGVYHAKKTIETAGGSIHFQSSLGQGTTVTVTLPTISPRL